MRDDTDEWYGTTPPHTLYTYNDGLSLDPLGLFGPYNAPTSNVIIFINDKEKPFSNMIKWSNFNLNLQVH